MKNATIWALMAGLLVVGSGMALAARDSENEAGAQTYHWNLSGAVMPVPPYGSMDIAGSDSESKLIVNQPNGKIGATVTGVMEGLLPDTTYTVYLSNGYTPYSAANVTGSYKMDVLYLGNHYFYDLTLSQSGNTIGGTLHDPYLPGTLTVNGTLNGNALTFSVDYGSGSVQGVRTFTGSIGVSGGLSGTWNETGTEAGSNSWSTISGSAKLSSGSTGWPGLLPGVSTFTFVTDDEGSGSWHYNFAAPAPASFSVWINGNGATVLISDMVTLN